MCKCGVFTQQDLNNESRLLWRNVATAYATDGKYQERMSQWSDSAVAQYVTRFGNTVGVCKCKVYNNETN